METKDLVKDVFAEIERKKIRKVFSTLMGINGDRFVKEIIETGGLSKASYDIISDNISYNGKESVVEHFGLVHWYYLQGLKK